MRRIPLAAASLLAFVAAAFADPNPAKWDEVLAEAKGETVYFNAWGGAENINAYLEWVGVELKQHYGSKWGHFRLAHPRRLRRKRRGSDPRR